MSHTLTRKTFMGASIATAASALAACAKPAHEETLTPESATPQNVDLNEFESLAINMDAWQYDETNDIYYQLGLKYCKDPVAQAQQTLAIFVPGKYFSGEKNGSNYSCKVNDSAIIGNFTPHTAPVLMPINSGVLTAQDGPTAYSATGLIPYMQNGCIYVYAGFRGRSSTFDSNASSTQKLIPGGAPWPVVDMKAAIRYLRYNKDVLPFDAEKIFTFGFDAGAGLCAVLGTSGDAQEFDIYLDEVGAATHDAKGNTVSDAIYGAITWCPNTSFGSADAAYEWSCGQYIDKESRATDKWTSKLSKDLAASYATYINQLAFRNNMDEQLTLDETSGHIYAGGSYADALIASIEESASYFASNTSFPYTYTPTRLEAPSFPGDPNLAFSRASTSSAPASGATTTDKSAETQQEESKAEGAQETDASKKDQKVENLPKGTSVVESTVYSSLESYLNALNTEKTWLRFSSKTGACTITNLGDFASYARPATASCPAFDQVERASLANQLFGIDEKSTLHFSTSVKDVMSAQEATYKTYADYKDEMLDAWETDLTEKDDLKQDMATRVNLFDPLYFVSGAKEGEKSSKVARAWRINEGAFNSDTSLTTSTNLVFALSHTEGVRSLDFTLVWGQGHVLAERSGTAAGNMLNWILGAMQLQEG